MTIDGINIIGDLTSKRGVTVAAQLTLDAIRQQGISLSFIEQRYAGFPDDERDSPTVIDITQTGSCYPINLFFYGISGFHTIGAAELAERTAGRYTIAYWVWEFPTLPEAYRAQFARVDEVWTASTFSWRAMRSMSEKPLIVIPHPIATQSEHPVHRARFGIPPDRYTFLFIFDSTGSRARKNPEGVIAAFEEAFGGPTADGPLLVIKARHIDTDPAYRAALSDRLAAVGGLLLSDDRSRADTDNLIACADAYVSLHRAEGFGLTMAEAMAHGKPVIATGYSGNLDYMTSDNSYPVGYTLRPVAPADHRDQPFFDELYHDCVWAEPDIHEAAHWMRYLVDNPAAASQHGERAAIDMARGFSPLAVGLLIRDRLNAIAHTQGL